MPVPVVAIRRWSCRYLTLSKQWGAGPNNVFYLAVSTVLRYYGVSWLTGVKTFSKKFQAYCCISWLKMCGKS